jgi:hypothetical protein
MARKRGNPNWGRAGFPVPAPRPATEFETQVRQLGLQKHNYEVSPQLRDWCEHNRNRCYVPEWLLDAWKMTVDDSYSGVTRPRWK